MPAGNLGKVEIMSVDRNFVDADIGSEGRRDFLADPADQYLMFLLPRRQRSRQSKFPAFIAIVPRTGIPAYIENALLLEHLSPDDELGRRIPSGPENEIEKEQAEKP